MITRFSINCDLTWPLMIAKITMHFLVPSLPLLLLICANVWCLCRYFFWCVFVDRPNNWHGDWSYSFSCLYNLYCVLLLSLSLLLVPLVSLVPHTVCHSIKRPSLANVCFVCIKAMHKESLVSKKMKLLANYKRQ